MQMCDKQLLTARGYVGHLKRIHNGGKSVYLDLKQNFIVNWFFIKDQLLPKLPNQDTEDSSQIMNGPGKHCCLVLDIWSRLSEWSLCAHVLQHVRVK